MNSEDKPNFLRTKIPTLFGMGVLTLSIVAGVFLATNKQTFQSRATQSFTPKNLTVANISDSSAAIYWQTDPSTTGLLEVGQDKNLDMTFKDDRDQLTPELHNLHFVTLNNLAAHTIYYYKIISGATSFPSGDPFSFQTASSPIQLSSAQPIIGTIFDPTQKPIGEALIVFNLTGAQKLATISRVAGNFILPLSSLRTADLSQKFDLSQANLVAQLTIFDKMDHSMVNINSPFTNLLLPAITLGQNLNLPAKTATQSAQAVNPEEIKKYDLNKDGVVNSLDLSFVIKNLNKKGKNLPSDLNGDGIVDQKDVDKMRAFILNPSSQ